MAWALSFCRVVPEMQWVDRLMDALACPAPADADAAVGGAAAAAPAAEQRLRLAPEVVLDLVQALKVGWGGGV